jgi:hypothetical protein
MRKVPVYREPSKVEIHVWTTERWIEFCAFHPEAIAWAERTPADATPRQLDRLRFACLAAIETHVADAGASQTVIMPTREQAAEIAAAFRRGAQVIDFAARARQAWLRKHEIELPEETVDSLVPPASKR